MKSVSIQNVRVFNGQKILPATTVTIRGDIISFIGQDPSNDANATVIHAKNGVLLPGLIDAHIHMHGPENLKQLAQNGVTTGLDMASFSSALISALHELANAGGLTDFRTPGVPACAPGSKHSLIPVFPKNELVANPEDAAKFVERRVEDGADYIKLIADEPGFDQETLNALVREATKHGKLTIAHATHRSAFQHALDAKVTVLTHVPMDKSIDADFCHSMLAQGTIAVPTLTMMEGVVNNTKRPGRSYAAARDSVKALHEAGVPILAGTDSNMQPGIPANVPHGESMHHELELLVDAGLSNLDALRAATSLPAKYFGLKDRGVIEVGKRADLLLVSGDPTTDIKATKSIQKVWCKGVEVESA